MKIQTNMNSINANNKMRLNVIGTKKATEKLSSGFRINRAADDAAGLGISEKMRAQIRGLSQGIKNTADGISLTATADGYLQEMHNMMHRMRELTVQASNDTYSLEERGHIQKEIDQLVTEIDDLTERAEFNGIKLFRGKMEVDNIQYSEPEFVTITPKDPAVVVGNGVFGFDGTTVETVRIAGGTQAKQLAVITHLETLQDGTPAFPLEGVFIIRVGIPGGLEPDKLPGETRDAILDFGELNNDGNFNLNDFREFFIGKDTGNTDPKTGNPIYADGKFSDWINAGELLFEVKDDGEINVETIGLGGSKAHITIGATTSVPAGKILANSAILGATATNWVGNNTTGVFAGFDLKTWASDSRSAAFGAVWECSDGVTRPVIVEEITSANESYQPELNERALSLLQANYNTCPVFWDLLVAGRGSDTFSVTLQERIDNPNYPGIIPGTVSWEYPNGKQEPEFLWPSRASVDDYDWANDGTIHNTHSQSLNQLKLEGAATFADARILYNNLCPTAFWSSTTAATISNLQVDRNGNIRFNWGSTSGSTTSTYPSPEHRVVSLEMSAGSRYYSPRINSGTTQTVSGLRNSNITYLTDSQYQSLITNYPAKLSQDIGTLNISIGGIPGGKTATANIDWATTNLTALDNPANPFDPNTLTGQINLQLNAPTNHPAPFMSFRDVSYMSLLNSRDLNYSDYPVGFAFINGNGQLEIRTAERHYEINVKEEQSDMPMFANTRTGDSGIPETQYLTIKGTASAPTGTTNIPLVSGDYTTTEEFYKAHTTPVDVFKPNYTLSMLNDRLVITSALTGKDITVTEITPFALAEKLGFGISDVYSPEKNPPTDSKADPIDSIYPMQFGFPITGWTWNEYDEQLPLRVIAFDLSARPLWIQGRDKNGEDQGLYIFLPHLSASRLKFSEYKVPEYEVTEELKGFSGVPTYKDKDDNEDVKRGLNVLTREDANSAIDTVQSALHIISKERSRFGAATNALEHMKSAVTNTHENLTAAESQIRDTDMAMAMAEFVKNNILLQATQAILAQANQAPQAILQLLR